MSSWRWLLIFIFALCNPTQLFAQDFWAGLKQYNNGNYEDARIIFERLINENNPLAMTRLGIMYKQGIGVKKDDAKALELFRKAANLGENDGISLLAKIYIDGDGVKKNTAEAARLYKTMTNMDGYSAYLYGLLLENGDGVKKDIPKAIPLFKQAFEVGISDAGAELGYLYANGEGIKKDLNQGIHYYRSAAERNNAAAQYNMGRLYELGIGVKKDQQLAIDWYEKAANQGLIEAERELAKLYDQSNLPQSQVKAQNRYEKAATQGDMQAMYNLGVNAYQSQDKNRGEIALKWWGLAAKAGYAPAQTALGYLYEDGKLVKQDHHIAFMWYQKAADQNDTVAILSLGVLYANGTGVAKDINMALDIYLKLIEKGEIAAAPFLANLYMFEPKPIKNFDKAYMWALVTKTDTMDKETMWRIASIIEDCEKILTQKQIYAAQKAAKLCKISQFKKCNI